jgi:subtilisin family serine protease
LGMNGETEEGSFADRLGHGTAVMAAIQEKAPGAEYFAVKVFDEALRTTADCLVRAIDWSIERKMDVVNLSLGTLNQAHRKSFEAVVARAVAAGTILVAARDVDGQSCLPGCLPGVYGIGLDWDCPRNCFRAGNDGEITVFRASGYPRSAPGVTQQRNLNGISFAVANMTGFIVRAMETSGAGGLTSALANVAETPAAKVNQKSLSS